MNTIHRILTGRTYAQHGDPGRPEYLYEVRDSQGRLVDCSNRLAVLKKDYPTAKIVR